MQFLTALLVNHNCVWDSFYVFLISIDKDSILFCCCHPGPLLPTFTPWLALSFLLLPPLSTSQLPGPSPVQPQLCLSIPLSLPGLTTVALFALVSLLLAWTPCTAFCAFLPALMVSYRKSTIYPFICVMSSIGSLRGRALSTGWLS